VAMKNKKALWWLVLGIAGIACLWLAYVVDPSMATRFGVGFFAAPLLATILTMGRDLTNDRITAASLVGLIVLLCLPWLL
jgi:hypothetical protein